MTGFWPCKCLGCSILPVSSGSCVILCFHSFLCTFTCHFILDLLTFTFLLPLLPLLYDAQHCRHTVVVVSSFVIKPNNANLPFTFIPSVTVLSLACQEAANWELLNFQQLSGKITFVHHWKNPKVAFAAIHYLAYQLVFPWGIIDTYHALLPPNALVTNHRWEIHLSILEICHQPRFSLQQTVYFLSGLIFRKLFVHSWNYQLWQ